MKRLVMQELVKWKEKPHRKPLLLQGVRQVGKTWILKEFGREYYKTCAYVNFEELKEANEIFDGSFDVQKMIADLSLASGVSIKPEETLLILDEIQEKPRALTALKYFNENAPEYHVAVAGSLLGVAVHQHESFPVGQVDFLNIYPLCFTEFLDAVGEGGLAQRIESKDYEGLVPFHDALIKHLKNYMITGGMPEVVNDFVENGDLLNTRTVQQQIINAYDRDFSKHTSDKVLPKVREIFRIIPAELARENKKFIFKLIRESARSREYEEALLWLVDAGIATRVECVNKVGLPLSIYADRDIFKLFLTDVGLLGAMAKIDPRVVLNGDALFTEFKGAMAEQLVFQELICHGVEPYYYGEGDTRKEVDFITDAGGQVTPIEVKSGTNLASASLNSLLEKKPGVKRAVKLSLLPYRKNEVIENMPLYLVGEI